MAHDGSIILGAELDTSKILKGLSSIGKTMGVALAAEGTGLAAAGTYAVKTGIGFESAFAGVKKTVEASDEQIAKLKQGILDLSETIPSTASDIASIAEAAGQLGIETDNILGFTEVMANLGVATNMSAEEAATSLARLANITGMPQTEFSRLGSTVVALGNNLATTEGEIVAMSLRLAGAGSQVGMTEAQIASFSGALSSVGIEAEAGGTAFSKLMADMQLATARGGAELEQFAAVAGMSAEEFATAFKDDAASAIISFIEGLSNAEASGKSAIQVLDEMGITEIRMRDVLLRASGASEVFSNALAIGNKAWEENVALTNEASQRYETMESKIQLLKNGVAALGIAVYEDMRGPIAEVVSTATEMVSALKDGFSEGGFEGLVSSMGEILSQIVEKITSFAPQLLKAASTVIKSFLKGIIDNMPTIAQGLSEVAAELVTAIVEITPLFVDAGIKLVLALAKGIGEQFPTLLPAITQCIVDLAKVIVDNIPLLLDAWITAAKGVYDGLIEALPLLIDAIPGILMSLVDAVIAFIPNWINCCITVTEAIVAALPDIIMALVEALPEIINGIINALTDLIPLLVECGINLFVALVENLPAIIAGIVKAIPEIIKAIIGSIVNYYAKLAECGVKLFLMLKERLPEVLTKMREAAQRINEKIIEGIKSGFSSIAECGKDMVLGVWDGICSMASWLKDKVYGFFKGIVDGVKGVLGIASPSKVFKLEVGRQMAAGAGEGFTDELPNQYRKIKAAIEGEQAALGSRAATHNGGGGAVGGNTYIDNLVVKTDELNSDTDYDRVGRRLGESFQRSARYNGGLVTT